MMLFTLLLSFKLALADADSNTERAKVLYENGKQLYDDGHYKEAIAAWERCHKLSQNDMMLFNLALAYEKNGETQRAITTLREYQAFVQTEEQRKEVINKIAEFESKLKAINAKLAEEAKRKKEAEQAKAKAEAEAKAKADADAEAKKQAALAKREKEQNQRRVIQYSLYGGAMVALGVGVGYGLRARGARRDLENTCEPMGDAWLCSVYEMETVESLSQDNINADIGLGLGAFGLGLALWNTFKPMPPPDINALKTEPTNITLGVMP